MLHSILGRQLPYRVHSDAVYVPKMIRGSARSKVSRSSKGSRSSDKQSWIHSLTRKSAGRVHTTFSLHTRLAKVLAEDRQDAFDPHATVVKMWEQSLLLCLLLEAFLLPYLLAFQPEVVGGISMFFVLIIASEFVFTVDIYVQAHMGYYSDGNLIRDKKRTIRRYVRSWHFALDVIAIIPVQILVIGFPRVVAKLLFVKLLRWSRLPHLVSSLDEFYAKQFVVLKLLKVLASTLYLAHVLACIRYSFGEDTSQNNPWLPSSSLHHLPLHRHYLAALFWSVGIMTGLFEGELPRHNTEFLFTILVALCGFSMFTTLCATIFVISKCESGNTEAVGARINQLVHVLSFHHVPENQQTQAIEYLKRYYTDAESTDRETAKILCPSIANDIQVELLKATIAEVSIFDGCSDQFIVAMTSLLEMIAVPAQTTLFTVGDHGNAMYVVHSGVLAIIVKSVTVREIRKGACFGELYVFSKLPCMATITTTTYAILYKLSRFHCERVLEGYPDCASVIAVHVRAMFKLLNISDDNIGSDISTSISVPITPRKLTSRRTSVTAGKTALIGGPTLIKIPSRRDSKVMPSRRESITQKLSKATGAIGPLRRDISQWSKRSMRSERIREPKSDTVISADTFLSPALTDPALGSKLPTAHGSQRGPNMVLIFEHHGLWRLVLFRRCVDHQSAVRMWWLLLLLTNLCYCWLLIPVQVIFPLWQRPSWIFQTTDTIANVVLVLDLVVNLNLSFMVDSDKVMDPKQSRNRYLKGDFAFDLVCALPYEYLNMDNYGLMRLPRLLRVLHLKKQLQEIEHFIQLNSRRQLLLFIILLIMMFHVVACVYFGISYVEGFDPNENEAWVCPTSLCLHRLNATHLDNCNGTIFAEDINRDELEGITAMEYFRSLYYAVGVLASPGKTVEPTSDRQLVAALVLMLGGFLISAIVVDNVQKRFTASAFEQKQFFETSTRIQLFLRRQKVPLAIHHRVKSFLDYWWSSHRGAVIRELLADLPRSMRLELLRSICMPVLQTLALLQGVHSVRDKLEEILVENAEFILYGQGETVYRHGDYVTGMFFLLEGEVCVVKMGGPPSEVPRGGFFGIAALTQKERGEGYTEHVSANRGCILLFVSREQLQAMEAIFPVLKIELLALDQRLLNNKLAGLNVNNYQEIDNQIEVPSRVFLHKILSGSRNLSTVVYDPDSAFILMWETWVFMVMTTQWVLVIFQACFPLQGGHRDADALMIFLEISFVLDMYIRSRLGYYEYGNKIMNPQRIKREYLKSGAFVSDIVALLPLYAINWKMPIQERWDLVNINKLLRLFKVPRQLHALETRYLKRTTELRLFKLLYYTFMLSHFLGCIWFNFASKVAFPNFATSPTGKQTAFGDNPWLPPHRLENGSHMLQYMASLYWSFGLMSSSGESEYPQTTAQCIFSVVTMTSGVFLFAYVIGNFTDIIELTSSESREFNVKMGAVRHMLEHFKMPIALQERVKTFLLFKRFHTISQEHLLGQCLPPSLLTDIRLVYLKPMIEKVDFLAGMETSITRMLVSQFTQVLVSRGEFVVKFGDSGSDMFFIFTGIVDVLLPSRIANRPKTTFKAVANVLVNRKEDGDSAPSQVGPVMTDIGRSWQQSRAQEEMKKVTEISAGSYFGENALFTDGRRDAYILAQTSCILYRLSRESLELVFDRYPKWKQKVLRIANINREQARLLRLSREEQRRGMITASGKVLSRSDIVNERAESLKQKRSHTPLQYSDNASYKHTSIKLMRTLDQFIFKPLLELFDGFIHGVPVQSNFHLFWVRFIVWCTTYVAIMVPYELTMDSMNRKTVAAAFVNTGGLLCQAAFILDVWFSWHVHGSPESMELYDQKLRSVYMRERIVWDILAAIPFYDFLSVYDCSSWFKLLRCIKFFNLGSYLAELNRRSVATEATRFWHVWMIYLLVIYWAACAYLAVSMEVGFGEEWEGWLPSQELVITNPKNASSEQLTLRLLRGLFFAMVAFVKKAYCPEPETAPIYAFHIGMSFVGLIVMSYVIGELASLFISYIGLEVNYRKNFIAVELYVTRLRLTERLKARTYVFMTSFWSSHAGVNYEDLLAEMPRDIRTACVLHVSKKPLTWFIMKVVTPICWEGGHSIDALTRSLAERLRFESYPRNEHVVTEGSIVRAMYFVMKGHLNMHSRLLLDHPVGLRSGGYFGERGLLGCSVSAYTVHTVRACDLLSLSSEAFAQVLQEHPFSRLALKVCDRAYKYLKGQHLTSCSRNDMEEHWGEALLLALQAVGTKTQPAPSSVLESTEKPVHAEETASSTEITAISSFRTDTAASPDKIAETERSFQRKNSMSSSATGEDSQAVHNTHSEFEKLSAHLSTMSKALNTAHGCFEAFAPLLHIMLSTDPLEWNASFNSPSVTTQPNALDTRVKATYTRRDSPFTTEQGKHVPFISHNDGDGHFDAH